MKKKLIRIILVAGITLASVLLGLYMLTDFFFDGLFDNWDLIEAVNEGSRDYIEQDQSQLIGRSNVLRIEKDADGTVWANVIVEENGIVSTQRVEVPGLHIKNQTLEGDFLTPEEKQRIIGEIKKDDES